MLRIPVAGLVLLFNTLTFTHGLAQCLSPELVTRAIQTQRPTSPLTRLAGTEATAFMAAFNALPPVSDHQADTVLVASETQNQSHLVLAFKEGCLVGRTVLSHTQFETIMDHVAGDGV